MSNVVRLSPVRTNRILTLLFWCVASWAIALGIGALVWGALS